MDYIQRLNEGECKDVLRRSLFKERTFLAMDNVSDTHQSIDLAKTFLNLPYHIESLVVVTAHSQSVLHKLLGIERDACLEMPNLGEADAVKLFLHHAIGGKEYSKDEEIRDIMICIRRCYFFKGLGQGDHYHPLALRCLGLQLGCFGESPSSWVKHLPQARAFNSLDGKNPVFDILRSGFDLLQEEDQTLFMDVGYCLKIGSFISLSLLCTAHQKDEKTIKDKLEHLKRKGLLEHVDLRFNQVTIHDLYLEFIGLELGGSFSKSSNLSKRMWMTIEDGDLEKLKCKPGRECWDKLIRLHINLWHFKPRSVASVGSLKGIEWKYFANVEVLQVQDVHLEHGALNLAGLVCLRILHLSSIRNGKEIEGLGELENLTHFEWYHSENTDEVPIRIIGQLPSSLKLLKIHGWVVLVSNALAQCNNLAKLELDRIEALSLDLSNCGSLESAKLHKILNLDTLLGLGTCSSEGLNLNKFNQLEVLDLSYSHTLTTLAKLGDLPKLRHLDLRDCQCLKQLPDLSKSKNLEERNLRGCLALILDKEDIQILSELPLLQPVPFQDLGEDGDEGDEDEYFRLNLHRRKLVPYQSLGSLRYELEERDLGPPLIEIGNLHLRIGNGILDGSQGPNDSDLEISRIISDSSDFSELSD